MSSNFSGGAGGGGGGGGTSPTGSLTCATWIVDAMPSAIVSPISAPLLLSGTTRTYSGAPASTRMCSAPSSVRSIGQPFGNCCRSHGGGCTAAAMSTAGTVDQPWVGAGTSKLASSGTWLSCEPGPVSYTHLRAHE